MKLLFSVHENIHVSVSTLALSDRGTAGRMEPGLFIMFIIIFIIEMCVSQVTILRKGIFNRNESIKDRVNTQ